MDKTRKFFTEGIVLFNAGQFYECHEALESIWLHDKTENRSFYQGLIQLAGAFHHVQKKRMKPAFKLIKTALKKLNSYSKKHYGIKLELLLDEVKMWNEKKPFPKIKFAKSD